MGYRIMEEIPNSRPKQVASETDLHNNGPVEQTLEVCAHDTMSPDEDATTEPNAATLDVTPVEINVGDKLWRDAHQRNSLQGEEINFKVPELNRQRSGTWTSGVTENALNKVSPQFYSTLAVNETKQREQTQISACNGDLDLESLDLSNHFDEQGHSNSVTNNTNEVDESIKDNNEEGVKTDKRVSIVSVLSTSSASDGVTVGTSFHSAMDKRDGEFTDINLHVVESDGDLNTSEQSEPPLLNLKHSNKPSLGSLFGWIASKASPTKTNPPSSATNHTSQTNDLDESFHSNLQESLKSDPATAQAETKKKTSIKIKSRFWRTSNVEPLSTTALILENRPRNLPEKASLESEKHRAEYEKMVENAKKSEVKDMQKKKKQMKLQKQQEDVIASASAVWSTEILPSWTTVHQTNRTRQLWWQGLPPNVRGKVWQLAIGNELNITQDLYEIMVTRAHDKIRSMHETQSIGEETESLSSDRESTVELIRLDISRTFPTLCIFQKGGPYHDILHDILGAYVCYRPDVGYVQGMSFMAAMLLLNMEPAFAFATFANLLNKPCQLAFFRLNEEMMKIYFAAFEVFFEENLPKLFAHFKQNNLTPDMYLIDWIFTMFSKALSFDAACRVWDIFCRDGEEFLFKTAIAILKLHEDTLLSMEFICAAQFLTRLPASAFTHHELFRHVADVTMVSRGNRRWKDVLALLRRDDTS